MPNQITKTSNLGDGRVNLPIAAPNWAQAQKQAQSFAAGTPGDLVQVEYAGNKTAFRYIEDGNGGGRYVQYDFAGQNVVQDPAPEITELAANEVARGEGGLR